MAATSKWVDMPLALNWKLHYTQPITRLYSSGITQATNVFTWNEANSSRLLNLLPEKTDSGLILRTRETVGAGASFDKGGAVAIPRGIHWANHIKILAEFWDTTLYTLLSGSYTTTTSMGATTDGPGGCTDGIDSSGVGYIYCSTKTKSVIVKTTGHTVVSDGDYPGSIIPTPVFMDSYIFVASHGTRKIFNSNVGDPTSWQASTYIETEEYGGNIVALARHKKFVVALCENHIEFFRDAGIPSPNSPLQRVPEKLARIGCINRATVTTDEDNVYFVGKDTNGTVGAFRIGDDGVKKISTLSIDTVLAAMGGSDHVYGVISTWNNTRGAADTEQNFCTGYMATMNGKNYYCVVTNAGMVTNYITGETLTELLAHPAFLYDPELNLWMEIGIQHFDTDYPTTKVSGGWFPYGTMAFGLNSTYLSATMLYQNPYGNQTESIAYGSATVSTAEVLDADGGFDTAAESSAPHLLQWPTQNLNHTGYKVLDGFQIMLAQGAPQVTAENNTVGTVATVNQSGTEVPHSLASSYPVANEPITFRNALGRFTNVGLKAWWPLVSASTRAVIEAIRLRITPHDES